MKRIFFTIRDHLRNGRYKKRNSNEEVFEYEPQTAYSGKYE